MSMYGRIRPDSLGRPSRLWLSKHARQVINLAVVDLHVEGNLLMLTPDVSGAYRITGTGDIAMRGLLDGLNRDGALTDEAFPVRRVRTGFELHVLAPDAALAATSTREQAMPMRVSGRGFGVPRQTYSQTDFVQLFALAEVVAGQAITEEALRSPDDLLARLPTLESVLARFGSYSRFQAFAAFQQGKLRGLSSAAAHERLLTLLERGG